MSNLDLNYVLKHFKTRSESISVIAQCFFFFFFYFNDNIDLKAFQFYSRSLDSISIKSVPRKSNMGTEGVEAGHVP